MHRAVLIASKMLLPCFPYCLAATKGKRGCKVSAIHSHVWYDRNPSSSRTPLAQLLQTHYLAHEKTISYLILWKHRLHGKISISTWFLWTSLSPWWYAGSILSGPILSQGTHLRPRLQQLRKHNWVVRAWVSVLPVIVNYISWTTQAKRNH